MPRLLAALLLSATLSSAQTPAPNLWKELAAKREALGAFHQEFTIDRVFTVGDFQDPSQIWVGIDWRGGKWRRETRANWRSTDSYFDGQVATYLDPVRGEFLVGEDLKDPWPDPYCECGLATAKAVIERTFPCGGMFGDHTCVLFVVPTDIDNTATRGEATEHTANAPVAIVADMETGLLIEVGVRIGTVSTMSLQNTTVSMQHGNRSAYHTVRLTWGDQAPTATLETNVTGLRRIKQFSRPAPDPKRPEMVGQAAPQWTGTDIDGQRFDTATPGHPVVLFFWKTQCTMCRRVLPNVEKMQKKHPEVKVMAIGIGEDRKGVDAFFKKGRPDYPIVLDAESPLPKEFAGPALPGFLLIDGDRKISAVGLGAAGFGDLKKLAKKAGINLD